MKYLILVMIVFFAGEVMAWERSNVTRYGDNNYRVKTSDDSGYRTNTRVRKYGNSYRATTRDSNGNTTRTRCTEYGNRMKCRSN